MVGKGSNTGIGRRQFLATLVAALGAGACSPMSLPKMGEGPPNVGMRTAMRLGPAPIKVPDAKFAFVQIAGAPSTHVIQFSRALDVEAAARNLTIVPEGDPSATYLVKGYLSAIGDRGGTLLVYVWDVTDTTGRRLHRVTGKEPAGGSGTDPWRGVDSEAVRTVAARTIDDLIAWAG
jgi:hypothetical protein